jgi:pyruvate dehydrogenase E2 component (dihydrolipoamide acetyltransferase)
MATELVTVPDIGGAQNVDVIEVFVKVGDVLSPEDPMVTLEGDKATMDIPSPVAGKVKSVKIAVGDKVSMGSAIIEVETNAKSEGNSKEPVKHHEPVAAADEIKSPEPKVAPETVSDPTKSTVLYASPAVRRLARELDIDVSGVRGTGNKNRITKEDLRDYVQSRMNRGSGSGLSVIEMPDTDFSKFGPVKKQALSKIQKLSGRNLHRNWVTIPHVTQFSEADITEMEVFREAEKEALAKQGVRLTPLVFLMKAAVAALKEFPRFNSSLASSGDELVMKSYYHIGVAVDTQNGLVVPVIRDVDKKGLIELARELAAISQKARETGLSMAEMQGGSFTISSLGGIGGTAFTPIINAPEVAIMGVSRTQVKPVWINEKWVARSMLPLSLSYDHRVIDGADGARFVTYFAACLQDLRKLLM